MTATPRNLYLCAISWQDPSTGLGLNPPCGDTITGRLVIQPVSSSTNVDQITLTFPADDASAAGILAVTQGALIVSIVMSPPTSTPWVANLVPPGSDKNYWEIDIQCQSSLAAGQSATLFLSSAVINPLLGMGTVSIEQSYQGTILASQGLQVTKYPRTVRFSQMFFTLHGTSTVIVNVAPNQAFDVNWATNWNPDTDGSCSLTWNAPSGQDDVSNYSPVDGIVTYDFGGKGMTTIPDLTFTLTTISPSGSYVPLSITSTIQSLYPRVHSLTTSQGTNPRSGLNVNLLWESMATYCYLRNVPGKSEQKVDACSNDPTKYISYTAPFYDTSATIILIPVCLGEDGKEYPGDGAMLFPTGTVPAVLYAYMVNENSESSTGAIVANGCSTGYQYQQSTTGGGNFPNAPTNHPVIAQPWSGAPGAYSLTCSGLQGHSSQYDITTLGPLDESDRTGFRT